MVICLEQYANDLNIPADATLSSLVSLKSRLV